MIQNLVLGMQMLGVFFIVFYCPYLLCKGISKMSFGVWELVDKIASLVPFWNVCHAEYRYKDKHGLSTILAVISFVLLVIRPIIALNVPSGSVLIAITAYATYAALFCLYAAGAVLTFQVLYDINTLFLWEMIIISIISPFGMYYIGTHARAVMEYYKREVNTFK